MDWGIGGGSIVASWFAVTVNDRVAVCVSCPLTPLAVTV